MSAPTVQDPRPGAADATPPTEGALAQSTAGRPGDFGLDVRRLRRVRLIVFALLSPVILVLALLAVRFVSMPITQAMHLSAYGDGDYPTAIERLAPVEHVNWFEPYLPHLSRGTSLLQQGEDAAAEEELRLALQEWTAHSDLNSPLHAQCKILNNLALSIERQADLLEDPQQRADRLYEAEELLAPCLGGGGGEGDGEGQGGGGSGNEDSESTEDNGERVEEKRREADEEAGNDPDARGEEDGGDGEEEGGTPEAQDPGDPTRDDPEGDGPEEEAPTSGSSEDQKDDELEQRNRDAQGGDGEDGSDGSDDDPVKPW